MYQQNSVYFRGASVPSLFCVSLFLFLHVDTCTHIYPRKPNFQAMDFVVWTVTLPVELLV